MMSTEDSLRVSENDDGTLAIEWDPNDPRYALFNDMSQEELQEYITHALEEFIKQFDDSDNTRS